MISEEEIKRIAALAHLKLTPEEVKKFSRELSDILDFFAQLQEIDTSGVEPTAQITGLKNVLRADEVKNFPDSAALLQCSPHPLERNQIAVQAVL